MGPQVDAQGGQAVDVDVLDVGRSRFGDHLELQVLLYPVGILAVPTVGRSPRGHHVGDPVGFGTENPEKRFRVHRAGAHFHIVRLLNDKLATIPEFLQPKYDFLQVQQKNPLNVVFKAGQYIRKREVVK